jgi:hypothetical protein
MKSLLTPLCAVILILAGNTIVSAQDKATASKESKESTQTNKVRSNNGTAKENNDLVYGKVEKYEPGKSLNVTVPGTIIQTKTFDLDDKNTTYNVPSNIKVGDWVSVLQQDGPNGKKRVTIKHSPKKATT